MLGLQGKKGCLDEGADADLVILSEVVVSGGEGEEAASRATTRPPSQQVVVDEVWKFGAKVFSRTGGQVA